MTGWVTSGEHTPGVFRERLRREAAELLWGEGDGILPEISRAIDCKYQGQSFELTVPLPERLDDSLAGELTAIFGREHERTYGHRAAADPIQLVNLRLTARLVRLALPAMRFTTGGAGERPPAFAATTGGKARRAFFGATNGSLPTPVVARHDLADDWRPGPLLVDEYDATTLVPPGCAARRDEHDNIVIRT